jgi:CRISPR-associated protein Cmr5
VQPGDGKKYTNEAKGAPALVMSNGLMQALAFLESRGENASRQLCRHVCEWLHCVAGLGTEGRFKHVMGALHRCDAPAYMRATDESLEILKWIRHFASATRE